MATMSAITLFKCFIHFVLSRKVLPSSHVVMSGCFLSPHDVCRNFPAACGYAVLPVCSRCVQSRPRVTPTSRFARRSVRTKKPGDIPGAFSPIPFSDEMNIYMPDRRLSPVTENHLSVRWIRPSRQRQSSRKRCRSLRLSSVVRHYSIDPQKPPPPLMIFLVFIFLFPYVLFLISA